MNEVISLPVLLKLLPKTPFLRKLHNKLTDYHSLIWSFQKNDLF